MTRHSDLMKGSNDLSFGYCSPSFFNNFGQLSRHLQTNKCGIFNHLRGCNYHHLTKKHLFFLQRLVTHIKCLWKTQQKLILGAYARKKLGETDWPALREIVRGKIGLP